MKCAGCGAKGHVIAKVIEGDNFQFLIDNGPLPDDVTRSLFTRGERDYCFICLCKISSVCIACIEPTDTLYLDRRCKNTPYVCKKCVKSKRRNHLFKCYSDGCLTPGELAQEEFEFLSDECEDSPDY